MLDSLLKKLYKKFQRDTSILLKRILYQDIQKLRIPVCHEEVEQTEGKINLFYATKTIKKLIYHRTNLMQCRLMSQLGFHMEEIQESLAT